MFFTKPRTTRGEDPYLSFGPIALEVLLRHLSRDIEEEIGHKGHI